MAEKFWDSLHTIVERIFQNEAEKRLEDLVKFENFTKKVNPQIIHEIYVSLATPLLLDSHIDLFQEIQDFYATPDSEYHSPQLQKRSAEFIDAFEEMNELISSQFTPIPGTNRYKIEPYFKDDEEEQETYRQLRNLSWKFAQAYRRFYRYGKKKSLSATEYLTIAVLLFLIIAVLVVSILTINHGTSWLS